MIQLWLINVNYYISFVTGFFGNALVVLLSLEVKSQEIQSYRWIICLQAIAETTDSILTILLKLVSLLEFL